MKVEQPIHIRLSSSEANSVLRDMLSSQMSLLRIVKSMKSFRRLRMIELQGKVEVTNLGRHVVEQTRKLESVLPKTKVPKILEKKEIAKPKIKIEKPIKIQMIESKTSVVDPIEQQLQEIQDRLSAIEQ